MKKLLFLVLVFVFIFALNVFAASDTEYLAKAIAKEMGNEPFIVRVIFGEMLLNRVSDEKYPSTLHEVCISLGIEVKNADASDSDKRAAAAAVCKMNFSLGALNFKRHEERHIRAFGGICLYGWHFY